MKNNNGKEHPKSMLSTQAFIEYIQEYFLPVIKYISNKKGYAEDMRRKHKELLDDSEFEEWSRSRAKRALETWNEIKATRAIDPGSPVQAFADLLEMPAEHIREAGYEMKEAKERSARQMLIIRSLLGDVRNGSGRRMKIHQDDVSKGFTVDVGDRSFFGPDLETALNNAARGFDI